jgi:AbrB family looped-hinge helix DNA binding protein
LLLSKFTRIYLQQFPSHGATYEEAATHIFQAKIANMNYLTVDKFGRVRFPKKVREQLGLVNSSQLKLEIQDGNIILIPVSEQPKVYHQGSVLVVESEPIGNLDIVEDLREERIMEQTSW